MPQAQPTTKVEEALRQLAIRQRGYVSVAELQQVLTSTQYTGPLVLHYRGGKAMRVELGRPTIVDLTADGS